MADQPKYKTMTGYIMSRLMPAFVIFFSLMGTSLLAQPHLYRISKTDRSDGQGYVVRYHLTEAVDSFSVIQPAPDLIQLQLYGDIDTTGIQLPKHRGKIQEIRLYKLDGSYGIDVYLDQDVFVIASAYPDGYSNDVLLGLTKADKHEVEVHSQQFLAKNWYLGINPEDALEISSPPVPVVPDNSYSLIANKLKFDRIVIDPGHGGKDPGNIGYRGTKEKDIVLAIAKKLGGYIEQYLPDVEVIYTREDDSYPDLYERGPMANRAEADLFVSIHANAFKDPRVHGTEVFFLGLHRSESSLEVMKRENTVFNGGEPVVHELTEEELLIYELNHSGFIAISEKIASMVDYQFRKRANRKSRGVKQAGFVVLYEAAMPAMLVEVGFLTNPSEQRFLSSEEGQAIIASAIFRAIRDYKVEYEKSFTTNPNQLTTSQEEE